MEEAEAPAMKLRQEIGVTLAAVAFVATVLYLWSDILVCCAEAIR